MLTKTCDIHLVQIVKMSICCSCSTWKLEHKKTSIKNLLRYFILCFACINFFEFMLNGTVKGDLLDFDFIFQNMIYVYAKLARYMLLVWSIWISIELRSLYKDFLTHIYAHHTLKSRMQEYFVNTRGYKQMNKLITKKM